MFSNHFDMLILKIIFLKNIILMHFQEKHFEKQPPPDFQTSPSTVNSELNL
jgi:hypothetical protein